MSWILAAFDTPAHVCESARGLVSQTPSSLFEFGTDSQFVVTGGIPETCHFQHDPVSNEGWIVVGLGLSNGPVNYRVMNAENWTQILKAQSPTLPNNGHYVILKWHDGSLQAFTDSLGTRTLYYAEAETGIVLSTRLDWVTRLTSKTDINYAVYGSHWLAANQIAQDSPIKGINRLGSGGTLSYSDSRLSTKQKLWAPRKTAATADEFRQVLRTFTNPVLPDDKRLSLGLSGGLDSRTLLALLSERSAALHSFGPNDKKDVKIARKVAGSTAYAHTVFHENIPTAGTCLSMLRQYVSCNQALTNASAVLGLRYYPTLRNQGFAMIDGGFGEVARRQFMNRLLRRGKKQLLKGNLAAVIPLISVSRPAIFSTETMATMREGVERQFENSWSDVKDLKDRDLSFKLDLISTRSRLPNFFGYEQNRLDGLILNFMPFAQPSFLDVAFNTPVHLRKEAKLFKTIIRDEQPALTKFSLVKGIYTYPFRLSSTGAFVWTKAKSKVYASPKNADQHQFLFGLREFILDTVISSSTRFYEHYDMRKVEYNVRQYFAGKQEYAGFVDWWLAFEVWRQEIKKGTA